MILVGVFPTVAKRVSRHLTCLVLTAMTLVSFLLGISQRVFRHLTCLPACLVLDSMVLGGILFRSRTACVGIWTAEC